MYTGAVGGPETRPPSDAVDQRISAVATGIFDPQEGHSDIPLMCSLIKASWSASAYIAGPIPSSLPGVIVKLVSKPAWNCCLYRKSFSVVQGLAPLVSMVALSSKPLALHVAWTGPKFPGVSN